MAHKPILVLDYDGCCTTYAAGWQGIDQCPDPPVPGLEAFLREALQAFEVHIHSARSSEEIGREAMRAWFERHCGGLVTQFLHFPVHKPPAMVTLDDRAVTFLGVWPDVAQLVAFQPWTRNTPPPHEQPPAQDIASGPSAKAMATAGLWQEALDGLHAQIRMLPHEPDIQMELEALWVAFDALRRDA